MTKQEFIDNLFEECSDALVEGDIDTVMDYFEKHYEEIYSDFESVFVNVITNIMDKSDLEKYKQKFGCFLYLYLANSFGIQDVYIPHFKDDWKFNAYNWTMGNQKPFTFKTVTLEDDFNFSTYFECDELIINCKNGSEKEIKIYLTNCKAKTIRFNTYIEKLNIKWCKNLYFDENAVIYKNNLPVLMYDLTILNPTDVEKVILPPVEGVQIPHWMCSRLNKNKVIIYKLAGQKIHIFSGNKEWLKEHVKSI